MPNLKNVCLICLNFSNSLLSVHNKFKVGSKQMEIIQAITEVMGRDVFSKFEDEISNRICSDCVRYVRISYQFKKKVEKSERTVTLYLGNIEKNEVVNNNDVNVEVISKHGKFDLKDIFVVEDMKTNDKSSFGGFLNNLGSEISVEFTSDKSSNIQTNNEVCIEDKENRESECVSKDNSNMNLTRKNTTEPNSMIKKSPTKPNSMIKKSPTKPNSLIKKSPAKPNVIIKKRPTKPSSYNCKSCNKIFAHIRSLRRHEYVHGDDYNFLCQLCGYASKTVTALRHHNVTKHIGKKFSCAHCNKEYFYKNSLNVHIKAVHMQDKNFLCTECGKSFSYLNSLIYHTRLHTGEKKYKCTFCDRYFRMPNAAYRHERTHTGERPYSCSFCQKTFYSLGEKKDHEMIHTGRRPYTCKCCNKGFIKMYSLKVHMMSHPGPFACHICTKTFVQNDCLARHIKHKHSSSTTDSN